MFFFCTVKLASSKSAYAQDIFQCQPTTDGSGLVYTPNIPDSVFEPATLRRTSLANSDASGSTIYIFPLPVESAQRNCSGNVVAIRHCYKGRNRHKNNLQNVFNFYAMNQVGTILTVLRTFPVVSIPDNTKCVSNSGAIKCCDTTLLSSSQEFSIPSSPFAFGVEVFATNANSIQPLAFRNTATEYVVNGYRETPSSTTYSLSTATALSLVVMRLYIGKLFTR